MVLQVATKLGLVRIGCSGNVAWRVCRVKSDFGASEIGVACGAGIFRGSKQL